MKILKTLCTTICCGLAIISCEKDGKPISEPSQINRVAAAAQHFVDAVDTASLAESVRQTLLVAQDFYALDTSALFPFERDIDKLLDFPKDTTVKAATETARKLLIIEKQELLDLTAFAARYLMTQKGYTKEDCDHILIELTGADGVLNKLEVNYSGKNNTLLVKTLDDYYWDYYDGERCDVEYHSSLSVVLPGKIEVTLSRGGTTIGSLSISDSFGTDSIEDPSMLAFDNSLSIKISAGSYSASLSATSGDGQIKASASLKGGKKTMISVRAKAEGIAFDKSNVLDKEALGKASASIDLMGEVQLKGSAPSVAELLKAGEIDDVRSIRQVVEDTNETFSAGVYYDGKDKKHATIKFAAFSEESDSDINRDGKIDEKDVEEHVAPVVYFENSTAFTTLESIFATEQFDNIVREALDKLGYLSSLISGGEEED